eukprot:g4755.t1
MSEAEGEVEWVACHHRRDLIDQVVDLLVRQWGGDRKKRRALVEKSCDELPTSFILFKRDVRGSKSRGDAVDDAKGDAEDGRGRSSLGNGAKAAVGNAVGGKSGHKDDPGENGDREKKEIVIAHARLQVARLCGKHMWAAATSVVVADAFRGKGFGRLLLSRLEQSAAELGFGHLYLWTNDKQGFYEHCGYRTCERVEMPLRNALQKLGKAKVLALESMLQRRSASAAAKAGDEDENAITSDTVYLVRQVREKLGSIVKSYDEILREVRLGFGRHQQRCGRSISSENVTKEPSLEAWVLDMPHERQIGPSCGITSLRCVREYCLAQKSRTDENDPPAASLLQAAVEMKITNLGEIFDINDLAALASTTADLDAQVLEEFDAKALLSHLVERRPIIIPFDKDPSHEGVGAFGGQRPHYGVLRGFAIESFDGNDVKLHFGEEAFLSVPKDVADDRIYFVMQHGTSNRLVVTSATALIHSNGQLHKFDEKVGNHKFRRYVNSRSMNLRCRALVLGPK